MPLSSFERRQREKEPSGQAATTYDGSVPACKGKPTNGELGWYVDGAASADHRARQRGALSAAVYPVARASSGRPLGA